MRIRLLPIILGITICTAAQAEVCTTPYWFTLATTLSTTYNVFSENSGKATVSSMLLALALYALDNIAHKENWQEVNHKQNICAILSGTLVGSACGQYTQSFFENKGWRALFEKFSESNEQTIDTKATQEPIKMRLPSWHGQEINPIDYTV